MNIAVVGAGAVGAVYARHLIRGGARVTLVVRPQYVDEVKRGVRLWRASSLRKPTHAELLVAHDVVSDIADAGPLDQVWMCVPSTGLNDALVERIGKSSGDALVVDLSPDLDGRCLRTLGSERLVVGLIPFIAYQTPLPSVLAEAHRAPGIAYWLPPLLSTVLSGPRARRAASALRAGGLSVRVVNNADATRALAAALLMPVVATLEASGWSVRECRRRLDHAADEATRAIAQQRRVSRGPLALAASPSLLRVALRVAELVAPLPLEPYLRYHFTKVGTQTRMLMRGLVRAAAETGIDAPRLRALQATLQGALL